MSQQTGLSGPLVFRYSVARELLWGTIDGKNVSFPAYSGGGRGSVNPSVPQKTLASYNPHRMMAGATRGGALPPGWWRILPPTEAGDSKGPWVSVLMPEDSVRESYLRDYDLARFKIHGTGEQGSDGCIVMEKVARIQLLTAVRDAGGARLEVLWEGERMNERLEMSERAAQHA
jgi:hypothetical protein